jgi:shikimate kinase
MSTEHRRKPDNLALVGFMGTGKSSTGHLLAEMLGFEFIDTDALIEQQTGKTIPEIFAQHGEPAFRELEHKVALLLEGKRKSVIATGGGFIAHAGNLQSLRRHALVVCLWASPEAIFERVRHQGHRPLLRDPDPLAKIRRLLAERESFYRQADVLVNTELRSSREVAQQVLHHFQAARV